MINKLTLLTITTTGLLLLATLGCVVRPVEKPRGGSWTTLTRVQPLFLDRDVDILFVIDNSGSMESEQKNLAQQFPKLIDALRTNKLGGSIPNVRIGVVSTDLGAGSFPLPSCDTGGDGGKLQHAAKVAGCPAPSDPWISYQDNKTNVPSASGDAIAQVRQAFSCIAQLGTQGCGFEQTLEAARRALDPQRNTNPGFLRKDPLLAVIFITDEDDCSASNPGLFDPNQAGALGPLTSYRCFAHGVTCQCPSGKCAPGATGPRKGCQPSHKYLHNIDRYEAFFKSLKQTLDGKYSGRVIMAAVAGPTDKVVVGHDGSGPSLLPSCQSSLGVAAPAVRLRALVHRFAKELSAQDVQQIKNKQSNTPYWVDSAGKWREENFSSICNSDFSVALERVGKSIVGALGTLCLDPPGLTENGGVVCRKGDVIGKDAAGKNVTCTKSCLDQASVSVQQLTAAGPAELPRCPAKLFDPKVKSNDCGSACPCWRVVPSAQCDTASGSSPYAVEVMRRTPAPKGTYVRLTTLAAHHGWRSAELAATPQCN